MLKSHEDLFDIYDGIMKILSELLALCVGNPPVIGRFPSQNKHRAVMFS